MRDAVDAIEAALRELMEARTALPEEFVTEIDRVITQTRVLLDSFATQPAPTADDATP